MELPTALVANCRSCGDRIVRTVLPGDVNWWWAIGVEAERHAECVFPMEPAEGSERFVTPREAYSRQPQLTA